MTCLIYGVVFAAGGPQSMSADVPAGVGGKPVRFIEANGLGAAVSTVGASDLTPHVRNALTFAKVVEAIHARRTIMPMRYGCTCTGDDEVAQLLYTQGERYRAILHRVDGCVEVAVQAALPAADAAATPSPPRVNGQSPATYLAARAHLYAARDQRARHVASATERMRAAFRKHALRVRAGGTDDTQGRVSVLFLVQRAHLDGFRAAFQELGRAESTPLRLSGPWPPYNFVAPEEQHGRRLS